MTNMNNENMNNENIKNFIHHIIKSTDNIKKYLRDLDFIDYMYFMKKSIKTHSDVTVLESEYKENENYIKQELRKEIERHAMIEKNYK